MDIVREAMWVGVPQRGWVVLLLVTGKWMSSERHSPEHRLSGEEQQPLLKGMSKSLTLLCPWLHLCLSGLAKVRMICTEELSHSQGLIRLNYRYKRPNASVSISLFLFSEY